MCVGGGVEEGWWCFLLSLYGAYIIVTELKPKAHYDADGCLLWLHPLWLDVHCCCCCFWEEGLCCHHIYLVYNAGHDEMVAKHAMLLLLVLSVAMPSLRRC